MARSSRCELLQRISELGFAADEARLFLDTHPCCNDALLYYKRTLSAYSAATDEYQMLFGPISSYQNFAADSWKWVEMPWPWEGVC